MAKTPLLDAPQVEITSLADLRGWLQANHTGPSGVWLVLFKKSVPASHVPLTDVVDACLCFGWVDSLPRAKDDARSMLYISPRKTGSHWSRVNKDKVARLIAAGLMTEAGQAVIDRAKADGTWTALDDVENLIIPDDLQAAFDAAPGTERTWHGFPRPVKRGALEILLNAKKPDTRRAKIDRIVDDCAAGVRPFQWTAKPRR
ncbi:YdeI/OmpD-associated family protein [Yoonia vestfoldensis]|uniref:YdeI/OmpD-associated family protein n=1 Tax=Yoonia vestfoldensis TaxID=245188 RepID=UPI0003745B86|nr:YdeI/OmpD-associated family protein [Yoonia vestfoldensis]